MSIPLSNNSDLAFSQAYGSASFDGAETSALNATKSTTAASTAASSALTTKSSQVLPDAKSSTNILGILNEKPKLDEAKTDGVSLDQLKSLSTEAILRLLDSEGRMHSLQSAKSSLESKAEEHERLSKEKIAKMQEQCDKLEEQSKLQKVKSIFSCIAAVFNVIVSAATMIGAIATGNVVLAIGAGIALASGVMQLSTSICATVNTFNPGSVDTKTLEIVNYVAMGVGLLGAAISIGGIASSAATVATKAISTATQVISASTELVQTGISIAVSVKNHDIKYLKAAGKEFEALLLELQMYQESTRHLLEALMEQKKSMAESVKEIVDDCNQSVANVVTAPMGQGNMMA